MIRLYLVRHGIAVDRESGAPGDEARGLSAKGRARFRRLARAFARLNEPPLDYVFSSPLVRAVQTAEILLAALRRDHLSILAALRPEGNLNGLLSELSAQVKDGESLALVGHDPLMTALVAALAEVPRERIVFRKGAIIRFDLAGLALGKTAKAQWWLRPKTRAQVPGLPLKKG